MRLRSRLSSLTRLSANRPATVMSFCKAEAPTYSGDFAMHRHVDTYPQDDAKARRKQEEIRRMRYRRAIERYWEERQLRATLTPY